MTSAIRIKDPTSDEMMFVTVDRPQGGFSLSNGSIELMQNRRILTHDGKGVGETDNEVTEKGEGVHTRNVYFVGLVTGKDTRY